MFGPGDSLLSLPPYIGQFVGYVKRESREVCSMNAVRWYVVQTAPGRERRVAEDLEKEGIVAYWPKRLKMVKVNAVMRKPRAVPLIPMYVFAGFDVREMHWRVIPSIEGICRLFMVNFHPLPIGAAEMAKIREIEAEELLPKCHKPPRIEMHAGDLVRIAEGPFAAFFALVVAVDQKKRRVIAEIDIFGTKNPAEFDAEQLELVS